MRRRAPSRAYAPHTPCCAVPCAAGEAVRRGWWWGADPHPPTHLAHLEVPERLLVAQARLMGARQQHVQRAQDNLDLVGGWGGGGGGRREAGGRVIRVGAWGMRDGACACMCARTRQHARKRCCLLVLGQGQHDGEPLPARQPPTQPINQSANGPTPPPSSKPPTNLRVSGKKHLRLARQLRQRGVHGLEGRVAEQHHATSSSVAHGLCDLRAPGGGGGEGAGEGAAAIGTATPGRMQGLGALFPGDCARCAADASAAAAAQRGARPDPGRASTQAATAVSGGDEANHAAPSLAAAAL